MFVTMSKVLIACMTVVAALSAPAAAQQANPFARLAGESRPVEVHREEDRARVFARVDGGGVFVLQQSGQSALLREDGSQEVIALAPARGVRGGVVWVTDTNQALLRFSARSEAAGTYFPHDAATGVIVEPVGLADPLAMPPMSDDDLRTAARDAAQALAETVRGEVSAEIAPLSPLDNGFIADALRMAAIAAEAAPEHRVRGLRTVRVRSGDAPAAEFDGRVLEITITPTLGYGGRPSSRYLQRVIASGG